MSATSGRDEAGSARRMDAGEWRRPAARAWSSERRREWRPPPEARRARRSVWRRSGSGARKWARDHRARATRRGSGGGGEVRRRRWRTRCAADAVGAPPLVSASTRSKRPAARCASSVASAIGHRGGFGCGGGLPRFHGRLRLRAVGRRRRGIVDRTARLLYLYGDDLLEGVVEPVPINFHWRICPLPVHLNTLSRILNKNSFKN
ncbi:hypothetical protein SORBI_3003G038300 [Sorghum bicolor]|uniref:Uncharacterized protein n=1 Tax=Sorghum bicolor TaxID=4558 RepID=A0A1B6Q158_SORBI|nr:hypothetical protein SORBI_3003G038300 [Sorghum bicolor]